MLPFLLPFPASLLSCSLPTLGQVRTSSNLRVDPSILKGEPVESRLNNAKVLLALGQQLLATEPTASSARPSPVPSATSAPVGTGTDADGAAAPPTVEVTSTTDLSDDRASRDDTPLPTTASASTTRIDLFPMSTVATMLDTAMNADGDTVVSMLIPRSMGRKGSERAVSLRCCVCAPRPTAPLLRANMR